jgi:hypothetical protein
MKGDLVFYKGRFIGEQGQSCALGSLLKSSKMTREVRNLKGVSWFYATGKYSQDVHGSVASLIGKKLHKNIKILSLISRENERGNWHIVTKLLKKIHLYKKAKQFAKEVL